MTEEAMWLRRWFDGREAAAAGWPERWPETNYFEAGLIDSLGVIELIADVEEHFGIAFDEGHFQDRRFSTIGGLGEIINELSISRSRANGEDRRV